MKTYTSLLFFLISIIVISSNFIFLKKDECYDFYSMPVLHDGRIKPLGTLIDYEYKNILKKYNKHESNSRSLADLFFKPNAFLSEKIFNINDINVKNNLGLKNEQLFNSFDIFYAFEKNYDLINKLLKVNVKLLNNSQKEIVNIYYDIYSIFELAKLMDLVLVNDKIKQKSKNIMNNKYELTCTVNMGKTDFYKLINKSEIDIKFFSIKDNNWFDINNFFVLKKLSRNLEIDFLNDISKNYFEENVHIWGKKCNDYNKLIYANLSFKDFCLLKLEIIYNNLNLIFNSIIFFSVCFLLNLLFKKNINLLDLSKKSFLIGVLMLFLDIIFRITLTQKSPVTSLHESIIFVNFIFTLCFLTLLKTNSFLIGSFVAVFLSFISLKLTGSNIKPVVAVLNTNFWLIIHVLTISIGYGLCIICGFLSHIYLYKTLNKSIKLGNNTLYIYVFYISLLALCFSFIGTLLGGIWADQSWGRFWGWDPKENGALLIVLWLTLVLHAKSANFISEIIFCVGMVLNLIVLALAWFGVNLLSVGLHSYGFIENIGLGLIIYISFECLILLFFLYFYKKNVNVKVI